MATATSSERILFVDDDAMVRTAFARCLKSHGFQIDLASGATEATKLVEAQSYAVIAADYRMPELDGLNLVHQLRDMQPDATFMLVSGECDLELALQAVNEFSISYVIAKPWNVEELSTMLRRSIESHWERTSGRALAESAMQAVKNVEAKRLELQQAARGFETGLAEVLLNSLDMRDAETRNHCKRVASYARMLGEQLGMSGGALAAVEQGALLHDIGKIGVPECILQNPEVLSDEEWEIMRRHPSIGARLLDDIPALAGAREVVQQHHERWDGNGYPAALEREQISLGARIFAVVDALDAILSDKPYRPARDVDTAVAEIRAAAGAQFDPAVVEAFAAVPKERWIEVRIMYPDEQKRLLRIA